MTAEIEEAPFNDAYIDLLWPLVMNGSSIGQVNWLTGLMSLDVNHQVASNPGPDDTQASTEAAVARVHETVHLLQVGFTGFAFWWVSELHAALRAPFKRLTSEGGDLTAVAKAVDEGARFLTSEERDALTAHYAVLDQPSTWGLTARAIIESHAYFVERHFDQVREPSDWFRHLDQAPDPVYRVAFDLLLNAIGPGPAVEWFSLVATSALCCARPAVAFQQLTLALAAHPAVTRGGIDRDQPDVQQRWLADFVADEFLGTAGQVGAWFEQHGRQVNPFWQDIVVAVGTTVNQRGGTTAQNVMCWPHEELNALVPALDVPVFYRPAKPQGFVFTRPLTMDEDLLQTTATVTALGAALTREIEIASRARTTAAVDTLAWLMEDRRQIQVYLDETQTSLGTFAEIVDPERAGVPARQAARAWGRVVLFPPERLDPTGDTPIAAYAEVRDLVQRLSASWPGFPIVLSYLDGLNAFVDWYSSVCADDAIVDGVFDPSHPSVWEAAGRAAGAMLDLGNASGQNPLPQIDLMLLLLPPEAREG